MTGKTYIMSKVEQQDMMHTDAHSEFNYTTAQPVSAVAAIITQLSLKAGLNQWGDKGKNAMQDEMKQLRFRNTFEQRHRSDLTEK